MKNLLKYFAIISISLLIPTVTFANLIYIYTMTNYTNNRVDFTTVYDKCTRLQTSPAFYIAPNSISTFVWETNPNCNSALLTMQAAIGGTSTATLYFKAQSNTQHGHAINYNKLDMTNFDKYSITIAESPKDPIHYGFHSSKVWLNICNYGSSLCDNRAFENMNLYKF